jgi:hypothetical protein
MQSAQPPAASAAIRTCAPRTKKEKRNLSILYPFFFPGYRVSDLTISGFGYLKNILTVAGL